MFPDTCVTHRPGCSRFLRRESPTQPGVEKLPIQARIERLLIQVEASPVGWLDNLIRKKATKHLSFVLVRWPIALGCGTTHGSGMAKLPYDTDTCSLPRSAEHELAKRAQYRRYVFAN